MTRCGHEFWWPRSENNLKNMLLLLLLLISWQAETKLTTSTKLALVAHAQWMPEKEPVQTSSSSSNSVELGGAGGGQTRSKREQQPDMTTFTLLKNEEENMKEEFRLKRTKKLDKTCVFCAANTTKLVTLNFTRVTFLKLNKMSRIFLLH